MSSEGHDPKLFEGVMVSSTFTDLIEHRQALIRAIDSHDLKPVVMENDTARVDGDVLDSSLRMVREASAYVGVISHKYGQIPDCAERNPDALSLTELEFREAQRLGRPILIFLMGDEHPVKRADVEVDPDGCQKLATFRETVKRPEPDAKVDRVYGYFNDLGDFRVQAMQAVSGLKDRLDVQRARRAEPLKSSASEELDPATRVGGRDQPIPQAPAFYAEPAYIGSHEFVGRQAQLDLLDDWAAPSNAYPVLLLEAIGGTGKSMLTWHWTNHRARRLRRDWAGAFWYSFYERGAQMSDFCQRALAYMTGQPLDDLRKWRTQALIDDLLLHLRERPWLLILDGLERVLVAYHRIDAARLLDDEAGISDLIAERDPCLAIRPEDDDLLRLLAGASPSKLLITSRLVPRILLNQAGQPISGVLRERLPGLRPSDAENLLRSCGITGSSARIQTYLQEHCDCHPLVIGVLAGLIADYLPARGDFDQWVDDPEGGGRLDLASLDLVHKRSHILHSALDALDDGGRQLLSTLSILSESADYPILAALSPYRRQGAGEEADDSEAKSQFRSTVRELERRGFLQFDPQTQQYDLHPVVRGVAAGRMAPEEATRYGSRVVDHFSQRSHKSTEEAETLDDVRDHLQVARALLQMGRFKAAYRTLSDGLLNCLMYDLEAYLEFLALARPWFPESWSGAAQGLQSRQSFVLLNAVGQAFRSTGQLDQALKVREALIVPALEDRDWPSLRSRLSNMGVTLFHLGRFAKAGALLQLGLRLAKVKGDHAALFVVGLHRLKILSSIGCYAEATSLWSRLRPMARPWRRRLYRAGWAKVHYADLCLRCGILDEDQLEIAEARARKGRSRSALRKLWLIRGDWHLESGKWAAASKSFAEAVRMAREVGVDASWAETLLVLARHHQGRQPDPLGEAKRLSQLRSPAHLPLAELWNELGDSNRARHHALKAYKWAWADGEPYVRRWELDKTRELLEKLEIPIPDLPPYDPAKDPKFPWEDDVEAAIEKLEAEKAVEEAERAAEKAERGSELDSDRRIDE